MGKAVLLTTQSKATSALAMQPSGATSHYQRSAVKQFSRQQQGDHSSSSSDQLGTYGTAAAAAYGRCPLVPCMPDLGRYGVEASWCVSVTAPRF